MSQSPYKLFWNWCFDGNIKSPVPEPDILLKYNSPISSIFLLKSIINNAKLNYYLNTYLNNYSISILDKEELFFFYKKCIVDFKISRRDIHYSKYIYENKLSTIVKNKYPMLKNPDIELLVDIINNSKDKDSIYTSFGLDKPKKEKIKKRKKKDKDNKNNKTLDSFLSENFKWVDV